VDFVILDILGLILAAAALCAFLLPLVYQKRAADIRIFSNYVARLLRAGLPINEGLNELAGEFRGKMSRVMEDIIAASHRDPHIDSQVQRFSGFFTETYASAIRMGRVTNRLPEAFENAGAFQYRINSHKARHFIFLAYPILLAVACIGVISFLALRILPTFMQIVAEYGMETPTLTGKWSLMALATWMGRWGYLVLAIVMLWFGARRLSRSRLFTQVLKHNPLACVLDLLSWLVPLHRQYQKDLALYVCTTFAAQILAVGGPVNEVLDAPVNYWIRRKLRKTARLVDSGLPLVAAFEKAGRWPADFLFFVRQGALSHDYTGAFRTLSEIYDARVQKDIKRNARVLGIILTLVMAAVVFCVCWSVLGLLAQLTWSLGTTPA